MKILNKRPLWICDKEILIKDIVRQCKTKNVEEVLNKELYNYVVFREYDRKQKKGVFARLLSPLYLLMFILIFFVICPIKYVFTGYYRISMKSKFGKIMYKWENLL